MCSFHLVTLQNNSFKFRPAEAILQSAVTTPPSLRNMVSTPHPPVQKFSVSPPPCPCFDLFMGLCHVHKRVPSIVIAIGEARYILHGTEPTLEYM
jgi:hypothetical protein